MSVAYNSVTATIQGRTGYPDEIVGNSTTDKVGFYGVTPVAQQSSSTNLTSALVNLGLLAAGNYSISVSSLALTSILDGKNIALGTTTGTQIATATAQKLAFYGLTPVIQQANSAQAAVSSAAISATVTTGSVTTGFGYSTTAQADGIPVAINAALTRVGALVTLVNQIRADLVAYGLEKGSA